MQCKTLGKYNFHLVYKLFSVNDRKLGMQRTSKVKQSQSLSLSQGRMNHTCDTLKVLKD